PVVKLRDKPFKKRGVWGKRPYFDIIGWKAPGDGGQTLPASSTPQLSGPAAAQPTPSALQASSAPSASPVNDPRPHPIPAPETKSASARRPVTLSTYTKAVMTGTPPIPGMTDVKPPTTEELLDDSLEDLPWDSEPKRRPANN